MRRARTSVALFAFWCIIVPPRGILDVAVGVATALTLSAWTSRFLWPQPDPFVSTLRLVRLPRFMLTMGAHIVVAASQVLWVVLDPRSRVAPVVVRHTVRFGAEGARVAFAHAITITPGTLALDVVGDTFVVHCLDERFGRAVSDGSLAREIERLFGASAGP